MTISKIANGTLVLSGGNTYDLTASPQTKNVQESVVRLQCDPTAGAIIVNLPEISSYMGTPGNTTLVIADTGLMAGTNNITINAFGSDTIEGAASHVIASNGGAVSISVGSSNFWVLS